MWFFHVCTFYHVKYVYSCLLCCDRFLFFVCLLKRQSDFSYSVSMTIALILCGYERDIPMISVWVVVTYSSAALWRFPISACFAFCLSLVFVIVLNDNNNEDDDLSFLHSNHSAILSLHEHQLKEILPHKLDAYLDFQVVAIICITLNFVWSQLTAVTVKSLAVRNHMKTFLIRRPHSDLALKCVELNLITSRRVYLNVWTHSRVDSDHSGHWGLLIFECGLGHWSPAWAWMCPGTVSEIAQLTAIISFGQCFKWKKNKCWYSP